MNLDSLKELMADSLVALFTALCISLSHQMLQ